MNPENLTNLERLAPLVGEWAGRGRGSYPTLEAFDYAETLVLRMSPDSGYLIYEQSTELVDLKGRTIRKSHWEAGILRPLEGGSVELACVQGSGRLEVLRGEILSSGARPASIAIRFESVLIANDARVRSSSREWSLEGDRFEYLMEMETAAVGQPALHLEATLERIP